MVDVIKGWMINIVTVIIFIAITEMAVSSERFKKYIKLVTGLVLMIVIVNPIVTLVNKGYSIDTFAVQSFNEFDRSEMEQKAQNVDELQRQQIASVYKGKLSENMRNQILSVNGVGDANVDVIIETYDQEKYGSILSIDAQVYETNNSPLNVHNSVQKVDVDLEDKQSPNSQLTEEIQKKLSTVYEVPSEKINIKIQKKGS